MGPYEIGFVVVIVLLLVVWLLSLSRRSRHAATLTDTQDVAYRSLASDAAETQRAMAQAQQELVLQQRRTADDLADLRSRVTHIENLLRDVG